MKKALILANNSVCLYNFRFELISELINNGFEVVFSLPELENDEKVKLMVAAGAKYLQTNINRRGINPIEDIKLIIDYIKIIKRENPDIILTYTIKPNIYGSFAAARFKKPVIINITGIGTSLNDSKLRYIVINLYKYACHFAKQVFFQNQNNYSLFVANRMVNPAKAVLIPGSGINTARFVPSRKSKDDGILRFLFIGRLMREKGIEEYIAAAQIVSKLYSNIEFLIMGSYEEEKYKSILEKSDNEKIKYLGTSNDVRVQIGEVDCIVNPSYHEGMSNVLLEGAAMGKPLIASDIPGCREIIEDGINGYLFEAKSTESLQDKLIQFVKLDNKRREQMGENSRKKVVAEFDRSIVIDEYMKAIKNFA